MGERFLPSFIIFDLYERMSEYQAGTDLSTGIGISSPCACCRARCWSACAINSAVLSRMIFNVSGFNSSLPEPSQPRRKKGTLLPKVLASIALRLLNCIFALARATAASLFGMPSQRKVSLRIAAGWRSSCS